MRVTSTTACVLASASLIAAAPHRTGGPGGPLGKGPDAKGPPHPLFPGPPSAHGPPPPPPHAQPKPRGVCENPIVRKEWRALPDAEKQEYIDAVLCLQSKPAITTKQFADDDRFNPINRFDDFQAVHSSQTENIHFVGFFSQWHRYMVAEYERTLRDVCGYKGAQPYWDWTLDANTTDRMSMSPYDSEIFSPTTGFGGNGVYVEVSPEQDIFGFNAQGRSGGGCVQDGPFTRPNFEVNIGTVDGPECLRRDFLPGIFNFFANPKNLVKTLAEPDMASFGQTLEGAPDFNVANIHGSGHFGVGGLLGQAGDAANSPAEPLFYLHHSQVDHVYWLWQQRDLETRLQQVGGPIAPNDFGGENVTADFEVNLGALAPSVKISQLLDTEGELLCYTYE